MEKKEINPSVSVAHIQNVINKVPLTHYERQEALLHLQGLAEHIGNLKKELKDE